MFHCTLSSIERKSRWLSFLSLPFDGGFGDSDGYGEGRRSSWHGMGKSCAFLKDKDMFKSEVGAFESFNIRT